MSLLGQKAPDFTLPDTEKNMVSLSSLAGKNVLILFFPFAFTGVCTKELCNVRDAFKLKEDTTILAISVDSPFTLGEFKRQYDFPFPVLSDFNKTTATAYYSLFEEFVLGLKGVAKRSAFIVDKTGTVVYEEVLPSAGDLPNLDAIQAKLDSLS